MSDFSRGKIGGDDSSNLASSRKNGVSNDAHEAYFGAAIYQLAPARSQLVSEFNGSRLVLGK
jgi:hypothetical protein